MSPLAAAHASIDYFAHKSVNSPGEFKLQQSNTEAIMNTQEGQKYRPTENPRRRIFVWESPTRKPDVDPEHLGPHGHLTWLLSIKVNCAGTLPTLWTQCQLEKQLSQLETRKHEAQPCGPSFGSLTFRVSTTVDLEWRTSGAPVVAWSRNNVDGTVSNSTRFPRKLSFSA